MVYYYYLKTFSIAAKGWIREKYTMVQKMLYIYIYIYIYIKHFFLNNNNKKITPKKKRKKGQNTVIRILKNLKDL